MKRAMVLVASVMMISATAPVFAADMNMNMHEGMKMDTEEGARQCALQAESIQQKIARIQGEIKKGSKAYDAKELKKLELKLKEANALLEGLQKR